METKIQTTLWELFQESVESRNTAQKRFCDDTSYVLDYVNQCAPWLIESNKFELIVSYTKLLTASNLIRTKNNLLQIGQEVIRMGGAT